MPVPGKPVQIGSPAPNFSLPSAHARTVSLDSYRGEKCVVLVFLRGFG